jgi:hypothetical protein
VSNNTIVHGLAGLSYKRATGHVFKLIHVSHPDDVAWHPELRWTQFRRGKVFTYNEAVEFTLGTTMPTDGRWFAIGQMLYSVE